jgi:hypothetical protein
MKEQKLSKAERKELKKLQLPSLLLGITLFAGISVINIIIYFRDIVIGATDRPPLSQLIFIEVFAGLLSFFSFYFLSKNLMKDLASGKKNIDLQVVTYKFIKNIDGKPAYLLKLKNALTVLVDKALFNRTNVGDTLEVEYSPKSAHVFTQRKVD